jgi:dCTP deaminase
VAREEDAVAAEPDGPWKDWVPGVLNNVQLTNLCEKGLITGRSLAALKEATGLSSIDLSLSDEGYELVDGAVKPVGPDAYDWFIKNHGLAKELEKSDPEGYTLKSGKTYVFRLNENLDRRLADAGIYGQATAKSSVGRVDVLARLIVDGMDTYEGFDPEGLNRRCGNLYLEITPITFDVKVKADIKLSQLRLFYGKPENVEISGPEVFKTIFRGAGQRDGTLSVDLTNVKEGTLEVAAFCSHRGQSLEPIPLWKKDVRPDPCKHWKFITATSAKRLKIEDTKFYILRSKETLAVPGGIAVYCRASDETIGEMRIHYAGFAHPLFGRERTDGRVGTPLIFEVRGHQVNVSLADGEKMANIILYRMSEDCSAPEKKDKPYEEQTLKLSDFFAKWPAKLKKTDEDGTVEAA